MWPWLSLQQGHQPPFQPCWMLFGKWDHGEKPHLIVYPTQEGENESWDFVSLTITGIQPWEDHVPRLSKETSRWLNISYLDIVENLAKIQGGWTIQNPLQRHQCPDTQHMNVTTLDFYTRYTMCLKKMGIFTADVPGAQSKKVLCPLVQDQHTK